MFALERRRERTRPEGPAPTIITCGFRVNDHALTEFWGS